MEVINAERIYPKYIVDMLKDAVNKIKNEPDMKSMFNLLPKLEAILKELNKKSIIYEKELEEELKIEYELFKINKKGCIQNNKKLKVLFFYGGRRNCTSRLQSDFILKLKNICDINVYGPEEHKLNSESICPIKYNKYITANDLIDELNPDIFLFHNITTFNRSKPRDLSKARVPIVLSEVDYFAVPEWCKVQKVSIDKWFFDNRIDFLITRGPYRNCVIPSVWLPFSVNEDEFYTDPCTDYFKNRKKDIGFIGSLGDNKYYDVRRKAVKFLVEKKLMTEEDVKYIAEPNDYANALKQYHILLSCSFPPYLNRPPAKNLESILGGLPAPVEIELYCPLHNVS